MKKILVPIVLILLISSMIFAGGAKEKTVQNNYVASTSWVASIAQLAGIDDVVIIAPANLKHPPEYEITPDDMAAVINSKLFMHAGYERMMKTIANASEISKEKIQKVKTTNTLGNLENMVELLSEKAGTQVVAKERFSKYRTMIEEARKRIEKSNVKVFANTNQAELAADLGLDVVETFGPGELTAEQIESAAKNKYVLVLDNVHNPVASPIESVSPSSIILQWRNFPEKMEKDALYNVIKANLDSLWATGLF